MKFFASIPPPPLKPPLRPPLARRNFAKPAPRIKTTHAPISSPTPSDSNGAIAPSIVGEWQEPGNSDMVEFYADGTLAEQALTGDGMRGRYSLVADKLSIQIDGVDPLAFTISIDAKTLELRNADGQRTRYLRIR